MSEMSALGSALQARIGSRSIGLKLIVVCGMASVMMIPAAFVHGVIRDRTERAADVVKDISAQFWSSGIESADSLSGSRQ